MNWFTVFEAVYGAEGTEWVMHHLAQSPTFYRPAVAVGAAKLVFSCSGSFGWAGKYGRYDENDPDYWISDMSVTIVP